MQVRAFGRISCTRRARFGSLLAVTILLLIPAELLSQESADKPVLSLEEKEKFLKTARITRVRPTPIGLNRTVRATLSAGGQTHDASVQCVDFHALVFRTAKGTELNFSDSYKFNIAAYRLALLLGIDSIPPSIQRSYERKPAAFTWWIDDVIMDEKERLAKGISAPDPQAWSRQVAMVRVFDQLIDNTDRNQGNLLITKDWKLWMIDHTRAFRATTEVRNSADLSACDGNLLARMKELNMEVLKKELGRYLKKSEMEALLARRDQIVKIFESRREPALPDPNRPRE